MTCVRGCCPTQRDHYRSVSFGAVDRAAMTKTTTDVHDTHTVDVTEHWADRQDVTVKPKTVNMRLTTNESD